MGCLNVSVVMLFLFFSITSQAESFYITLGLKPNATQEEIKKAWRLQVKQLHPDKGVADSDDIRRVNMAKHVLGNANLRPYYDHLTRYGADHENWAKTPGNTSVTSLKNRFGSPENLKKAEVAGFEELISFFRAGPQDPVIWKKQFLSNLNFDLEIKDPKIQLKIIDALIRNNIDEKRKLIIIYIFSTFNFSNTEVLERISQIVHSQEKELKKIGLMIIESALIYERIDVVGMDLKGAQDFILKQLQDKNPAIRVEAISALNKSPFGNDNEIVSEIHKALQDRDFKVGLQAEFFLSQNGRLQNTENFLAFLKFIKDNYLKHLILEETTHNRLHQSDELLPLFQLKRQKESIPKNEKIKEALIDLLELDRGVRIAKVVAEILLDQFEPLDYETLIKIRTYRLISSSFTVEKINRLISEHEKAGTNLNVNSLITDLSSSNYNKVRVSLKLLERMNDFDSNNLSRLMESFEERVSLYKKTSYLDHIQPMASLLVIMSKARNREIISEGLRKFADDKSIKETQVGISIKELKSFARSLIQKPTLQKSDPKSNKSNVCSKLFN